MVFFYLQAPQMVFFKDAVEHILRAARVFRQPGGHMLMVSLHSFLILVFMFIRLVARLKQVRENKHS